MTDPIQHLRELMEQRDEALSRARAHVLRAVNDPNAPNRFRIASEAFDKALRNLAPELVEVVAAARQIIDRCEVVRLGQNSISFSRESFEPWRLLEALEKLAALDGKVNQ